MKQSRQGGFPNTRPSIAAVEAPIAGIVGELIDPIREYRVIWSPITELEATLCRVAKDRWRFLSMHLFCEGGLQDGYHVVFERAVQ